MFLKKASLEVRFLSKPDDGSIDSLHRPAPGARFGLAATVAEIEFGGWMSEK